MRARARAELINPEFCLLISARAPRQRRFILTQTRLLVRIAVPSGPFCLHDVRARPLRATAVAAVKPSSRQEDGRRQ